DHAHRVIEVRLPHFVFEINGQDFFGNFSHLEPLSNIKSALWGGGETRRIVARPALEKRASVRHSDPITVP
ncbi:MAG TPA: hypothetical protein PK959_13245, partial [Candidatus Competibacteraceae bacterium]|nr:hypothetical protein [Candidatus Competibacteraceae bacterium]